MASLTMTSAGILVGEHAPSPIEDPKIILLPWVIGAIADSLLQGIITIQLLHYFSYFNAYRCSSCSLRSRDIFVFVLGVLSFAKSGQCVAIIWKQNITYKLDPVRIYDMELHNRLKLLTPFTTALLGYFVQIFSLIWYWKMSRRFWVSSWCSTWLLASFITLIVVTNYLLQGNFDRVPQLAIGHLAVVAIADFSLSLALGSHIWQAKSDLPGPILNRLVRAVFISGLPCAIAALVIVICFATLPSYNLISVIFNIAMAKLYVISCLYTLNCRNELREECDSEQEMADLDLDEIRFRVGDWEKTIGPAGDQAKVDNDSQLIHLDKERASLCPCDGVTLKTEILYPGSGETVVLHDRGLSSDRYTLAGGSVLTPMVEFDVAEPHSFEKRARRKTIGGSDMV